LVSFTPITVIRSPATRISWPTGSDASKSFSASSAPSTTTGIRCVTSTSEMARPFITR